MNAAEQLMGSHGFHATTVSALCQLSGYPTGSLSPRRFRDLSDPNVAALHESRISDA
uniref:TetR family transcriptional regulator n=1 Tax=Streptomyces hawaiiensis TaxID=67305 RepID=UPI0031E45073